jgi:hypothetical protein
MTHTVRIASDETASEACVLRPEAEASNPRAH